MELGDVWRIIKGRKLLVAIAFAVFYMLVVAATVLIYRFAPAYPSEAVLELKPPKDVFQISEELVNPKWMEAALRTEAAKLKHLGLLQEVLAKPEIKVTKFYKWYGNDFQKCLYDLEDMVQSAPVHDTRLIRVSLACQDKSEAKLIVETIVRAYQAKYAKDRQDSTRVESDVIKATLAELHDALVAKRQDLTTFREIHDVPALIGARSAMADHITMLSATATNLNLQRTSYEAQLAVLEGVDMRLLPVTPEMQIIIEADPILRYYRSRVEELGIEMAAAQRNQLGTEHRYMQRLEALREGYYEKEVAKREELVDQLRARQVEDLSQTVESLRAMLRQAQEQLDEAEAKERDLNRNIQQYQHLLKDEERLQDQIAEIEALSAQADHQTKTEGTLHSLVLVQSPIEALKPSRPNLPLYLGGGFVLSLLGALGLAFLREFTDKTIRTPLDVMRAGQLAVLGCIPQLDEEEADVDEIELATRLAPHSLVAEAFRQTRTNLLFSGPAESQSTLLITSSGPGDGKTAVAINLAVTVAQGNERVLLVDCNFRRPGIRGAFRDTRPEGLSNILIGQGKLEDLVTKTDLANLDVLTSGPMPPTPAELLGSKYMVEFIQTAAQRYDRVILDGPPVLLVSDALIVANQIEGVILVARAIQNSKGAFKRAREQLERVNARVVGAVLNGVAPQPGGYFKQQYRDFYDYTSEDAIQPALPEESSAPVSREPSDE
jgi:capsular exopolysaccharide synthesis family protein